MDVMQKALCVTKDEIDGADDPHPSVNILGNKCQDYACVTQLWVFCNVLCHQQSSNMELTLAVV